jgi:hypothetical protein
MSDTDDPFCDFCGTEPHSGMLLFTAQDDNIRICDQCVKSLAKIVHQAELTQQEFLRNTPIQ